MTIGADRRRIAWAAVAASAMWSAGLWAVKDVRGLPILSPPPMRPPRAVYVPLPPAVHPDQPHALAIWSPTLFALPSPWGFSGITALSSPLRPPVDIPSPPLPYLSRLPWQAPAFSEAWPPLPLPSFPPPPRGRLPPPAPFVEATAGTLPPGVEFPLTAGDCGPAPWTAEALVELDGWGIPTGVWIGGELPAEVRAGLARSIARWRWPGNDPVHAIRLRLVHPGAPALEEASP